MAEDPGQTEAVQVEAVRVEAVRVEVDDLTRPAVRTLLAEHQAEMRAVSPPQTGHALDVDALAVPGTVVWTAWDGPVLLGCLALRQLTGRRGELKSMRTTVAARRRGVASLLLARAVDHARAHGWEELLLETGSYPYFAPARAFYTRHGFTERGPFEDYPEDPSSVFLTRRLAPAD